MKSRVGTFCTHTCTHTWLWHVSQYYLWHLLCHLPSLHDCECVGKSQHRLKFVESQYDYFNLLKLYIVIILLQSSSFQQLASSLKDVLSVDFYYRCLHARKHKLLHFYPASRFLEAWVTSVIRSLIFIRKRNNLQLWNEWFHFCQMNRFCVRFFVRRHDNG